MSNQLGADHQVGMHDEEVVGVWKVGAESGSEKARPEFALQGNLWLSPVLAVDLFEVRKVEGEARSLGAEPPADLFGGWFDPIGGGHHRSEGTRLNSSHVEISYAVFC